MQASAMIVDSVGIIVFHDGVPHAVMHVEKPKHIGVRSFRLAVFTIRDNALEVQELPVKMSAFDYEGALDRQSVHQCRLACLNQDAPMLRERDSLVECWN